ncbi:MAG TPA: hypothetical protein VL358_16145 [Caulobacteraceae bacterium]|nr:hypothetical protein [Caulobacteraceae bacterium]
MSSPLRRLIDLPGVKDLEYQALMKPRMAEPDARPEFPQLDAVSMEIFGLTADQAEATPRPEGWDRIERKPVRDQVLAFEAEGWDVTDDKRRPLRLLGHFSEQLWLAIRGVAGTLPFHAEPDEDKKPWGAAMAADAARFRKDRR